MQIANVPRMSTTSTRTAPQLPAVVVGGLLMGAADIVPGVSGGTVALLLGIYAQLIANIRCGAAAIGRLLHGDLSGALARLREVQWAWLASLGAGIIASVVALTSVIEHQLEANPIPMSGLFLGLVAGSAVIAAGDVESWTRGRVLACGAATVLAFVALGLRPAVVHDPSPLLFAGAGAVAICAMILPGVSGSFLLLTMGMYEPLLGAVDDRSILPIAAFLLGATAGLASFSTVLSHALTRWHDMLLAVLVGLMLGSVRVLWPWPAIEGVGDTSLGAPDGQIVVTVIAALLGLLVVLGVAKVARRRLG